MNDGTLIEEVPFVVVGSSQSVDVAKDAVDEPLEVPDSSQMAE